jgi:hypothetical protein
MRRTKLTLWVVVLLSVSLLACKAPGPPAVDTIPPRLTLTAFNRGSNPIFNSSEPNNLGLCVHFPTFPASFFLSIDDPGGVSAVSVEALNGHFVPDSIDVAPGAPESSRDISTFIGGEVLVVRLTPPAPGIVRTGAVVLFKVDGSVAIGVRARAIDYRDNRGEAPQVDARITGDGQICRD